MWKGVTNFIESVDQRAAEGFKPSPRRSEQNILTLDVADVPPAQNATGHSKERQGNMLDESLPNGGLRGDNTSVGISGHVSISSSKTRDEEDPWSLDYEEHSDAEPSNNVITTTATLPISPAVTSSIDGLSANTIISTVNTNESVGVTATSLQSTYNSSQRSAAAPKTPTIMSTAPLPPVNSFSTSNKNMAVELESLKKQIDQLKRAAHEAEIRYEKALSERDKQFLLLEGDFEVIVAQNKGLSVEVQYLNQHLNDARKEKEIATEALEEAQATIRREQETTRKQKEDILKLEDLVKESHARQDHIQEKLGDETRRREYTEKERNEIRAQLMDYKTKSRMLLDERERSIEKLEGELVLRAATKGSREEGDEGDHFHTLGHTNHINGDRYTKEQLDVAVHNAKEATSRQYTESIFMLEEKVAKLQQDVKQKASSEKNLIDEIDALKLHNSQLRDMYEGEQNVNRTTTQKMKRSLEEKEVQLSKLEKTLKEMHISNSVMGSVDDQRNSNDNSNEGSSSGKNYQDVERRARDLANALLEKQAALEAKRAEADQWRTRYEVGQQRLREAEIVSKAVSRGGRGSTNIINGGGVTSNRNNRYSNDISVAENGGMDTSQGFRESRWYRAIASKGTWGRHIAGVVSTIDVASLRFGIILQRNSLLRIVVLLYFVMVQLYLFIALSISSSVPVGSRVHEVTSGVNPTVNDVSK